MGFGNIVNCSNNCSVFKNCSCIDFAQDLLNLCEKILTIEDDSQQWATFECFKRQFLCSYRFVIRNDLFNNCSELLHRIHKFKGSGLTLSSLLLDVMTMIYWKHRGKVNSYLMGDIQEIPFLSNDNMLRVYGVFIAFRTNPDFMKLLLHSNYLSSLPEGSLSIVFQACRSSTEFIERINRNVDSYSVHRKVVKLLNKVLSPSKKESNIYKRLYLILCALHVVQISLKGDHVYAEKLLTCLKMYFTASREPLITIFEVRSFLYVTFSHLNALHLFDQYSQEFDRLMPEIPDKMEPRKLSHLTRYQVRQNLKASHCPLPASIQKLGLPKTVRNFILGDVLDASIKNGNASSQNAVTKEELRGLFLGDL